MRSGPARFPFELLNSFGTESADITLADTTEQLLFKTLFSVEQHIEQHEAYEHIEQHWLLRDMIKREVTAMKFKSGEFTIDVVKLDSVPERNAADLKNLPYIATTFGGRMLNSKNTAVSRSTKSEAVLLQFDEKTHVYKLLSPLLNDVMHRTPHVINLKRYGLVAPSKSKALDSWVVNQGSQPFQSRLSERLIVREMDPECDDRCR